MLKFQSVVINPMFSNFGRYASFVSFWLKVMHILANCILAPAMPMHTSLSTLSVVYTIALVDALQQEEHQLTCENDFGITNNVYSHTLVQVTPKWYTHDRAMSDRRPLSLSYMTFLQCYRHPSSTPLCIVLWLAFLRMSEVKLASLWVYRGVVGTIMVKNDCGAEWSPTTISIAAKARSSSTQGHIL